MPELPEVETIRRGLAAHLLQQRIQAVTLRETRLRWSVPADLPQTLTGLTVNTLERRGKYLLFQCADQTRHGHLLVHLGMSGSLRLVDPQTPPVKHEHLDIVLEPHWCLRYKDPRRFGCVLWTTEPPAQHPLLVRLGLEPLSTAFDGHYLYERSRARQIPVKTLIMDNQVLVGVGNIYASESLFLAGIRPQRPAHSLSRPACIRLADQIRQVLEAAIAQGGTTLRDFVNGTGKPGYFSQSLQVYGRTGLPCLHCGQLICQHMIGQRSSYYCPHCQS